MFITVIFLKLFLRTLAFCFSIFKERY